MTTKRERTIATIITIICTLALIAVLIAERLGLCGI